MNDEKPRKSISRTANREGKYAELQQPVERAERSTHLPGTDLVEYIFQVFALRLSLVVSISSRHSARAALSTAEQHSSSALVKSGKQPDSVPLPDLNTSSAFYVPN